MCSPFVSTGTRPEGECRRISSAVRACESGITSSSNGAPECFSASHPRKDQDE